MTAINHPIIKAALTARALSLVVATTGSATLAATATGYTRSAGSFVDDGFVVGMEATPSGFPQATPGLVTAVTPTLLTIYGGRTAATAASGRSLTVGLPTLRAFNNEALTTVANRWYVEGEYSPSAASLTTITASNGRGVATGEFYWRLYGIAGMGDDAHLAIANALLACYPPGDGETLSNGAALHIEANPAPSAGTVRPDTTGYAVLTVTVPWRCAFTNPPL